MASPESTMGVVLSGLATGTEDHTHLKTSEHATQPRESATTSRSLSAGLPTLDNLSMMKFGGAMNCLGSPMTNFRWWQSIAGSVLLLLALPPMCLWVRSIHFVDELNWASSGFTRESVTSARQRLIWTTVHSDQRVNNPYVMSPTWRTVHISKFDEFNDLISWKWQFLGAGVGWSTDSYRQDLTEVVRKIPYWMLVVPATCIGGCMIVLPLRRKYPFRAEANKTAANGQGGPA